MKHTKSMIYKPSDEARELFVYTVNNGRVWPQIEHTIQNLRKYYKRGTYDANKAADAYYYIATTGSAFYKRDFGYSFSVQDRWTAAVDMVEYFTEDLEY